MFWNAGVFQAFVRGMPGLDIVIDREAAMAYRADPYFMIAFALSMKGAIVFGKNLLEVDGIAGH